MLEGFPVGEPFCCAEVVTNSSEKVIISYLICETSKQAEADTMVKNNIEVDVKVKCIENETTQAQLAGDIGTTKSYVSRIIKKQEGVVNKTFVQMMEALGYDIELTYVKREKC